MNWLLLRGLMRQKEHWGEFADQMQLLPGVERVVCIDSPGVGTENGRFFSPRLSDVVIDIRNRFFKDEKNKSGKWGILGHSLGAMIAMQWVNDFPEDFSKLVCISTSTRETLVWKRLTLFSMKKSLSIFLEKDIIAREKKIIDMISNLKKNDTEILNRWVQIAKKYPVYRHVAIEQLLAASLFKLPPNIKINTLILASRADRMVNHESSKFVAKKLNAPIFIHPTAGHDIPLDDTNWVLEKITQF